MIETDKYGYYHATNEVDILAGMILLVKSLNKQVIRLK